MQEGPGLKSLQKPTIENQTSVKFVSLLLYLYFSMDVKCRHLTKWLKLKWLKLKLLTTLTNCIMYPMYLVNHFMEKRIWLIQRRKSFKTCPLESINKGKPGVTQKRHLAPSLTLC